MALCFESWLRNQLNIEIHPELKGASLERVEVSKVTGCWNLHLNLCQPVESSMLDCLADEIGSKASYLNHIEFKVKVTNDSAVNNAIEQNRSDLKKYLEQHGLGNLLDGVRILAEGHRLSLMVSHSDLYEQLLHADICRLMGEWMAKRYNMRPVVRVLHEQATSKNHPARSRILDQNAPDVALNYNPPSSSNGQPRTRSKKSETRSIKGEPVAIKDLEEGMRGVVIEAMVMERSVQSLKGGRFVISYCLTDYSDSIVAKSFVERANEDGVEEGRWLRIKGQVRYDQFHRDVAFFVDAVMPIEKISREDSSPEKRVELHAHTKMSFMDGLTNTGELIAQAARWGHQAIAITDHGCVQAFPDAFKAAKKHGIKLIYGVEGYLIEEDRKEKPYHIIILAATAEGIKNMYRLISQSYIDNFYSHPKIKRADLQAYRQGLLLGSACEKGELYQALLNGASEEVIEQIVDFYDYIEVQPPANNKFLVREGILQEVELLELTRQIVELGQKHGKTVAATGDVHFLDPHDEVFKMILQAGQGYKDVEALAPLYFKSTEEMLDDFDFLGRELAEAVVIHGTQEIASRIDNIKPVPDGFYPPVIAGAEEDIRNLTMNRAFELYGDPLPEVIAERIERELKSIVGYGYSVLYLVAHKLVKKSNDDGYLVGSRGSVGSSLVAFLTGITEVNAMPAHYICPHCRYSQFFLDGSVGCGPDLPDKDCPRCGAMLRKDGFDIPFETFMGFEGDKVPDIDLNFSGEYQSRAHSYVEEIFGRENVYRAGTISTIAEQTAFGFVKKWAEEKGRHLRMVEMARLARGITGVRRTTGQHPGGLVVVPSDHQIYEFTPIQHPADKKDGGVITTHFDYHAIDEQLVKLDILGHDDPTVIKMLEDLTGIKATEISLSDPATLSLFSGVEALSIAEEDIGSEVGTFGIPEFGTRFVRQMLVATKPSCFADLVRISGLSHGTDVWLNNAQELIQKDTASLKEVICTRDDIMTYLIYQGMDKKLAFKIMESVRKGKGVKEDEAASMSDNSVPDWYVESCRRIKYMFPKAHAVAYVTMAYRIAWFKVFHPLAFYAAFFTIRADEFEPESMLAGIEGIKKRIEQIDDLGVKAPEKDKKLVTNLEVAMEMHARGFRFLPVDLNLSEAFQFKIVGDGLLLPFSALAGVGENAARSIVLAREQSPFISVEDLQARARVNKTVLEVLRGGKCLDDLPESSQINLFN